jgi:Beta-galactosidase trimerisation domain
MRKIVVLLAIMMAAAVPYRVRGQEERPVRMLLEAEDFAIERGWKVVPYGENYFASTFAITFLSRQTCLGAPEQAGPEALATLDVDVPVSDSFQLLARYEQPYQFSVEFDLEIVQDGKAVRRAFGRPGSLKYWAFQKGKTSAMQWWFWGGGDNIVWQKVEPVKLNKGKATLRLIAGKQLDAGKPRALAARRHVDVICLTNDVKGLAAHAKPLRNYLPFDGMLTQEGDLFVRVTNPRDGLGPCVPILAGFGSGQRSPWFVHDRDWPRTQVLRKGILVEPKPYRHAGPRASAVDPVLLAPELPFRKEIPPEQYLQPGETSGWVPLGQVLDSLNVSIWQPQARYLKGSSRTLDLELEFAIPDGKRGLRSMHRARVKGTGGYPFSAIGFEMPGNVRANPTIRTHLEALQWLKKQVDGFPKKGKSPRRLPIYGIMGFSGILGDKSDRGRTATDIALALGSNTLTPLNAVHAGALGIPKGRKALAAGHWPPSEEGVKKACDKYQAEGTLDQVALVSYGDEHYVPPARIDDRTLAAWMKERKITFDGPVKVTSDPKEPLFYYAQLCAFEKGVEKWAAATRYLSQRTGGQAVAGVNYGPASHNMVDEINFIRAFRLKGMSVAWSEDYCWQMPEFSVQIAGYRTSGFRAGTKEHGQPILQYVMPHSPGNVPRDVRLSFYTNIAHGAKMIHFYCATPSAVGITENYIVTSDVAMFRTVHDLCHEAGVFEDYILDGKVRPARVALLLSSVDDLRNPSTLQKGGHANAGRKAIYYALRHAQVPVDFLSEEDVIANRANDYQVIYVTQEYLHSRTIPALKRWVERGGTLVALCGGGFRDEWGKDNPATHELYGVKRQSLFKDDRYPVFQFKQDLPPYRPLGSATWGAVKDVPVILWKQSLEPADGKVLGTFKDGKPALIEHRWGKGRAVLFGFMPGLAYLKSGLALKPWDRGSTENAACHYLPTEMDAGLRKAIVDDFLPAGFVRPVTCSETLVETTCIDTAAPAARLAVPLLNYTGKPIAALTVRIDGLKQVRRIRSVEQGELKARSEDGALVLTLPLKVTDMLLIDR